MNEENRIPSRWNAADELRKCHAAAPWFTLGVMYVLTDEQWQKLMAQAFVENLCRDIEFAIQKELRKYPMPTRQRIGDATQDVLLKLHNGTFLKRFDGDQGHPKPYLLGSARQYGRVIARSNWRQYKRDNGIPPQSKREKPEEPGDPECDPGHRSKDAA